MRIVYLYTALTTIGGADRVIINKANYFAEKFGYDVTIITDSQGSAPPIFPLSSKIHLINLNIMFGQQYEHSILLRGYYYVKLMRVYKRKVTQELKKIKPDFTISVFGRELDFLSNLDDGSLKIEEAHVAKSYVRNFHLMEQRSLPYRLVVRYWRKKMENAIKRIAALIVLTEEDANKWNLVCENVHVIPNSLPFNDERSSECSSKDIICVGRLNEQKGFDLLIDAWALIRNKYPEWRIHVYGEGLLKRDLETQIEERNVKSSFILEDPVADIQKKYLSSSFYVLSSRFEGFGMALIEAMSCGLPCISFDCPSGPSEIISDNVDGLLVKNGDIQELSEKIVYMIEHPEERKMMGQRAKKNVIRYSEDVIMERWRELFNHLIEQKIK